MKHYRIYLLTLLVVLAIVVPVVLTLTSDKNELDLRVANGGEFELQTVEGRLSQSDLFGKVVVVFFGYLSCPDYCPTTMSTIADAFELLSENELSITRALFISVDPGRDSVELLDKYAKYFHENIIGSTANKYQIDNIIQRYGGSYRINTKDETGFYTIDHSVNLIIINPTGTVSARIREGAPPTEIAKIIGRHL